MSLIKRIPARAVRTVRGWVMPRIGEMPADMDYCESDCRRLDCSAEDWDTCENRLDAVRRRRQLDDAENGNDGTSAEPRSPANAPRDG